MRKIRSSMKEHHMKSLVQSATGRTSKSSRTWRAMWFVFSFGLVALGASAAGEWGIP